MTHLKCPDCGITLIDRSGLDAGRRCPRCRLRTGATVPMIRSMKAPTTPVVEEEVRSA
jgi:hypothetical protein